MSRQEFLEIHGAPRGALRVDEARLSAYQGRVPDDLVALWLEAGFGSYADGCYWFCEPRLFDPYLHSLFSNLDEFIRKGIAAFGYSCLGTVDLWHKSGRHLTYDLAAGLLMDLTSLRETASAPYNVEALMGMVGIPPEKAKETFLASRAAPEDIWLSLGSAVDKEGYRLIYTDTGKQLVRELRRAYGSLLPGEIYFRRETVKNEPESYEKTTVEAALRSRPKSLRYTRYIDTNGQQQPLEIIVPIR